MSASLRALLFKGSGIALGIVLALGTMEAAVRLTGFHPSIDPGAYTPVSTPGVEYTLRPNWRGESYGVPVVTNAWGFRGPEPATDGTGAIVFIGDSLTFGFGVREEETYPHLFGEALRSGGEDVQIVNLAVPGYNADQAVAVLAARIDSLHPRCIIYGVSLNDDVSPQFLNRDGWLVPAWSVAPWIPLSIRQQLVRSHAVQLILRTMNARARKQSNEEAARRLYAAGYPLTRAAMMRLARLARDHEARAHILILPFLEGIPHNYPFRAAHAALAAGAAEAEIPVADALPFVEEEVRRGTPLSSLWVADFDHHANAGAQALFANALLDAGACR